jgi:hypothetical protein
MGALIAAAGITAAGAVAGGAMSMSAAGSAARATGKASKSQKKALKQANEQYERSLNEYNRRQNEVRDAISKINPNIQIPAYNLQGATQEAIDAANRVTANTLNELQKLIGENPANIVQRGLAEAQNWGARIERTGQIAETLAEGDLTERQRKQIAQINAEMVGATYNPEAARRTAGFQIGQAQLLEATRQASEERQRFGLSIIPQLGEAARGWQNTTMAWMDLGRSWQQPVVPMMQMAAQGRQQDIGVQEANILNQMRQQAAIGGINLGELQAAQSRYAAATGQAQQNYDIAQRGIQADLALGQSRAQMVTEGTAAIGTALSAGAGAYNQYATAANASTTPMDSGFYRGQLGAANAYNVAPSQLSYQAPSGGFLGIGGQQGGYYYTPSGVYGR